jgi:hypothetical protein
VGAEAGIVTVTAWQLSRQVEVMASASVRVAASVARTEVKSPPVTVRGTVTRHGDPGRAQVQVAAGTGASGSELPAGVRLGESGTASLSESRAKKTCHGHGLTQ